MARLVGLSFLNDRVEIVASCLAFFFVSFRREDLEVLWFTVF